MTRYWNLIALLFSVISMSSIADDTTHTGVVRIEGIITAKTCIVADESKISQLTCLMFPAIW